MIQRFRSIKFLFHIGLATVFLSAPVSAQEQDLKAGITEIVGKANGTIGVGIMHLETRETTIVNEKHKFPMQSVFKFPLAMAVLDQVDKGKLSLDQKIHITKKDLLPKTHSPLRDKYPDGNVDITLAAILDATVSWSDNNGCDILFRLLGGPKNVQAYIHNLGVKDIAIVATGEEMSRHWDVQFTNWCEPKAMLQLLNIFQKGKKLSKSSTDFLRKSMVDSPTGPKRIKGLLPKTAVVAHKTGTSGTNDKCVTAANNDVGIITLPDGKHIALVVYVSNSTLDEKGRDLVIAQIAKAAYDHYAESKK
ncbi:class A beta-lactamase, subclass A2 [Dyadobacter bucti]|uniref:class A beta-lactamase, subclass A2 n=1 Tax=Dyadobacter bucti TaxID=2572203 RepID=UPI0011096C9C|nr:class A beta-lactamase, subclass A2 [Dyadobacter bucti]